MEAPAMLDASPNKKGANDVVFMKDFRASNEVNESRALSFEPDDLADALAVMVPKCRRRCCFLTTQIMDFGRCCDLSTCMASALVRCCSKDTFDCRAAIWATTTYYETPTRQ